MSSEISALLTALVRADEVETELRTRLAAVEADDVLARAQLETIREERAALLAEVADLRTSLRAVQDIYQAAVAAQGDLRATIEQMELEAHQLAETRQEARVQLEELRAELADARELLGEEVELAAPPRSAERRCDPPNEEGVWCG